SVLKNCLMRGPYGPAPLSSQPSQTHALFDFFVGRLDQVSNHSAFRRQTFVLIALFAISGAAVSAQTSDGGPDPTRVRVRFGPLWMNPTVALTNLGIDQNVFNE